MAVAAIVSVVRAAERSVSTFGNPNLISAISWREAGGMILTEVSGKEDSTCKGSHEKMVKRWSDTY